MTTILRDLLHDERGANLLEYSILMSFIALAAILAVTVVGRETTSNIEPVLNGL